MQKAQNDGFFDFEQGVGIELNICYNIVLAMDSQLQFSSTGCANTFSFTLTPEVMQWTEYNAFMNQDELDCDRSERASSGAIASNWIDVSGTALSARHIVDSSEPITRASLRSIGCAVGQTLPARPHILVVDDNKICQRVLCHTLHKLDCTTEVAFDGRMACELVKKHMFDIIFMDLRMPFTSGLEATRILVQEMHIDIPIIGFSAENSPIIHEECLAAGMSDFLVKPAKQQQIREMLELYCDV